MKRGREDLLGGQPAKRPASGQLRAGPAAVPPSGQRLTTNDALSYLREVKNRFQNNKVVYDTFLEIMKEFKAQRVDTAGVIVRVKELFKGHQELILGFNTFLPKGYEIRMEDVMEPEPEKAIPKQPVEFDQAINYVNKIKTRFSNDERVYKAFLEILNMYRKGQKTISNVYEEVALLFNKHPDLLEEFTYFLPDSSAPHAHQMALQKRALQRGKPSGVQRQFTEQGVLRKLHQHDDYDDRRSKSNLAKELHFFEKVKARLRNREAYQDFLKCLNLFAQEIIAKVELKDLVYDIIGRFPDLLIGFQEFLARCEILDFEFDGKMAQQGKMSVRDIQKMKQISQTEKYMTRPVSELDVSSWTRCSTSYVMLPKDYPMSRCSGRTEPLRALLNDIWISVTTGSEDYSFKHMRKNQYEEALFRVEDDRFELDMVIECNASAIRAMRPMAEVLENLDPEERATYSMPEGACSAIHFRAVQKIYGDQGPQVVRLLVQNPAVALPIVLSRMQQKDSEWRKVKSDMARQWQKVYDANYHKSLDHRSFYFKQTDKRNLGAKAMLAQIKELVEKRRADDAGLAAVSAGADFSAQLHPDLTYNYSDREVHNDVFKVLKYAVEEMMAADAAQKVIDFWIDLLERFFDLPPRTPEERAGKPSDKEEAPKAHLHRGKHRKRSALAAAEEKASPAPGGGDDSGDNATPAPSDAPTLPVNGEAASAGDVTDAEGAEPRPETDADGMTTDAPESDVNDGSDDDDDEDATGPATDEQSPSDAEEDANRAYLQCKPLAPVSREVAMAAAGEQEEVEEAAEADAPQRRPSPAAGAVFFGNDHYYVLLRLHRFLYERLKVAHTCAQQVTKRKLQGQDNGTATPELSEAGREEYRRIHGEFMRMVMDLIDGTVDSSQFEDNCRALLGTNSYVLFTLDKLIYKTVKQVQAVMGEDLTHKLFELYQYETSRSAGYSDAIYAANAHVLLHEDNCFRCERLPDRSITLQLMDPDKSEVPAGVMEPGFADYLKGFVDSGAGTPERASRVFLMRNFPRQPAAAWEDATMAAMQGAEVVNGLECKLSCATSKVSYVLDTEDIFRRPVAKDKASPEAGAEAREAELRAGKFQQWLDHQHMLPASAAPAMSAIAAIAQEVQ